ncbi:TonB-dependent receptor [Novosphingobium aromaticivorans DSM 12444]|uniref:TonB-dependent receptor n=1 Tax=Novosphingobium aromaticivorans (strain ATCC 700278 / DSM 12444 / CCUG 56034 / CIP 105152 / NBRC 16084 / F199) TaxID=279238 RepID=Q2G9Y3_NOVAD|nr:TonB-dependent receptor [Novosphingobium aromaticivorans]ABD25340.1 TonB-dependent receptor [Novosphingobium aromaticivorans DSM 12444]SCX90460.1 iron complex outermembrane recepter protein [Novosphingobium aromaticivorans]
MKINRASARLLAHASLVAATFAVAQPALAQSADVQADASAEDGNEIIVTAQKRAQSLSDVSLSVAAVGTEQLAANNTVNLEGLQTLVPSISFGNDFNFAKLFIRGIGLSSSLPGVDPSVALHVDGVVVSLAQAQLGSMFDLERVEVLRGPQGTLYGRNATGGAVNLITAKPTDTLDGYVRQTIGGDALLIQTDAAIGGPIAEGVRARLAVQRIHRDGYGINEYTGNEIDNANQWSVRGHLQFLPTDKLSILLTGELHTEDDRSLAVKFREVSFPGTSTASLTALGQRTNADGSQASFAKNVRNLNTNFDPINDRKQYAFTGIVDYDASDAVSLKSLTTYRNFRAIFFHDFDMSSYRGYPLAETTSVRTSANHWQPVFQHQFSQELQANVETDKLHAVVAAFYLKEKIRVENHIGYDVLTNTDPYRVQFDGKLDVETWAAFANVTYDLSDQFSIKLGGRYSWEKRHINNNSGIGTAATGFVLDPLQWNTSKTWTDFSPSAGFEFRPNDDVMAYFNWSRGFKSGTAEIGSRRSATATTPFVNPEKVEAFEGGVKYSAGSMQANLAVFYHKLKNGQFQRTFPIPNPPFFASALENAAESRAYGAEFELRWRPVQGLSLDASAAYLNSKFTKFFSKNPLNAALFGPGGSSLPDEDLSGNYTRMSPKWTFNFNPTYQVPLNSGASVTLGANVSYRSKQYHTEFNDDRMAADSYAMVDANVKYRHSDDRTSVNLWVRNLTDKLVWAGSYAVATSRTIGGTLMPPRTYGVTLGYEF